MPGLREVPSAFRSACFRQPHARGSDWVGDEYMTPTLSRWSVVLAGAGLLLLAACSKAPDGAGGSDAATPDVASAPASKVTSKKTEWSVGGIVGGKTDTTTVEPASAPPAIVEPESPREEQPRPQSGLLTAGDVDDLLNPGQYAKYAGRFLQQHQADLPFVDTRTRVTIKVADAKGRPVPFAHVLIQRGKAPLKLTTVADGTASFFPSFDHVPSKTNISVSASAGTAKRSFSLAGTRVVQVILPGVSAAPPALDLAL
jgi:hypothetical protein